MPIRLDRERAEPLRSQLEGQLREAIRSGRLRPDERLPSSRGLARELNVSRGLVLESYSQLRAEGYLISRTGSGTRVAPGAHAPPVIRATPRAPRHGIDFRFGLPDLPSFPRRQWARVLRDACRTAPAAELGYGDTHGNAVLREALAGYLRRVRGATADADRVVVCSGSRQGVELALRALVQRGARRVGLEHPGHPAHRLAAAAAGVEAVPVPVDERGMDVAALAALQLDAVVVTPAFHCPTGVPLAPERRQALISWASQGEAVLIEDDYEAELSYDQPSTAALQSLATERVATVGSVGMSLAPGVRRGWVVCPPELAGAIATEAERGDRGCPALDQLALAALIESGAYDRHLRRARSTYATRREALESALARHSPRVEVPGQLAGFNAVVPLPDGVKEDEVVCRARERSVGVHGMGEFCFGDLPWRSALVLGFGNLGEGAIESGVATLSGLLEGAPPAELAHDS